jgi:periplasmic protein TonB
MSLAVTAGPLLAALVSWSEQVFVLAAGAALAALTLTHAKARLRMWQGLLVVLLLLPAIEPWKQPPVEVNMVTGNAGVIAAVQVAAPSSARWRAEDWLWVIAAGAALRLLWVAAGFLRLRRYRKQAKPLAEPPLPFTSDAARWYVSDSVPGPVTYGWRRPVILLPARVLALPAELCEAIECHELIHVRRGDWLSVLAEALVRSLLWFHPAIWFVLGRIQLAREQVVDREAVDLLQNRESYLDALVAVAGHKLHPDLAPAPLFLRKRHLAARVAAVVREVNMSRSRIVAGVTAVCSAVSIAACAAIWMFPFVSQAQTAPDGPGITVEAGATLLHRAPVHAPAESTVTGTVTVQATLDTKGEVSDARVVGGPDELRKESLTSVLQWHYQPGPAQALITIRFAGGPQAAAAAAPAPVPGDSVAVTVQAPREGGGRGPVPPPPPPPQTPLPQTGTIQSIQFSGLSAEAEQELRGRLQVREGDVVNQADLSKLSGVVSAYDSHLTFSYTTGVAQGAAEYHLQVRAPGAAFVGLATPADAPPPNGAQRVSSSVQSQKLISHPFPVYPPIAKNARVQGTVTLQAIIGTDGTVQNLALVSAGSPLLVQSAMDAVRQWVYQPTLLNGNPVPVVTTVDVNFTLATGPLPTN